MTIGSNHGGQSQFAHDRKAGAVCEREVVVAVLEEQSPRSFEPVVLNALPSQSGAAIELLQGLLTSSRTADWADIVANGLGVLAAWAVAAVGGAGWARHVEAWIARRGSS